MDVHRIQVLRYCLPQSVSDSGLFYNHIAARLVPATAVCVRVCEHVWTSALAVAAADARQTFTLGQSDQSEGGE